MQMPAVIKAYSMAVAPDSSLRKRLNMIMSISPHKMFDYMTLSRFDSKTPEFLPGLCYPSISRNYLPAVASCDEMLVKVLFN
jgi:hypothetical protein